jgi:hypothetical protein
VNRETAPGKKSLSPNSAEVKSIDTREELAKIAGAVKVFSSGMGVSYTKKLAGFSPKGTATGRAKRDLPVFYPPERPCPDAGSVTLLLWTL